MTSAASLVIRSLLLAVFSACSAHAQEGGGAVLKGASLTEQNLVAALTPRPEGVSTRKVVGTGDEGAAARHKPRASLLMTFETNSAELTPVARRQLEIVAAALKNDRLASYSFIVEGHADPRGTADGNQVLSEQRAQSVREHLVSAHGIDALRLHAEGRGDREPLNRAQPAAAENRRVTLVTQVQ